MKHHHWIIAIVGILLATAIYVIVAGPRRAGYENPPGGTTFDENDYLDEAYQELDAVE